MKTNPSRFKSLTTTCLITLIAISCSSQKDKNEIPTGDFNISIRSVVYNSDENVVDVNPIQSSESSDKLMGAVNKSGAVSKSANAVQTLDIQLANNFDFISDVQTNALEETNTLSTKASVTKKAKASEIPMGENKKYRLIFMQEGSSTPIYNALLSPGQDPQLRVAANKKYFWYALSVNDSNSAPNIDGSGNIAASDLSNRDFMYASGQIITKEENNYFDITFLRQMAAVNVTINTRGIFGDITDNSTFSIGSGSGSTFTNIIQTGTFNILKGEFTNLRETEPVKGSEMTIVDSRWGNAEKTARFYTANTATTISADNLRVRINALSITLDDGTIRNFASNTLVPIKHSDKLTLTKGTLSKTNVRLIESGIDIDGLVWARTNLVYDVKKLYGSSYNKGYSDAYRFRTNNAYAKPNLNTEFWNFGTTTPTGTDYSKTDVCYKVYPEGTWRLPQESGKPKEMSQLVNNTNRTVSITSFSDGYRHSKTWACSQKANPAYPDNNLILSYYGYRDAKGVLQQQPIGNNGTGWLLFQSNEYNPSNKNSTILHAKVNKGNFPNPIIETIGFGAGTTIRCVRMTVNN
ncbi:hypothetical protein [Sphingobacterium sp.]|uniref:hypothetical protein n=1 Tax=Sphingobacterium sp. TaxID=341027 RepID=UPI00258E6A79|nr:hypothetical protein [Sphingobacterium sp.]WET68604.1 MAG: hypothetical protein P0Y57_22470 [Sphingobacterium sp.]